MRSVLSCWGAGSRTRQTWDRRPRTCCRPWRGSWGSCWSSCRSPCGVTGAPRNGSAVVEERGVPRDGAAGALAGHAEKQLASAVGRVAQLAEQLLDPCRIEPAERLREELLDLESGGLHALAELIRRVLAHVRDLHVAPLAARVRVLRVQLRVPLLA